MKLVILESPFRGVNLAEREDNIEYARRAARRCALDQESVQASHLLFPQFLDEDLVVERELGISLGLAWVDKADFSVFFTDRGWSSGMENALTRAIVRGRAFRLRSLDGPVQLPKMAAGDWRESIDMERGIRKWP